MHAWMTVANIGTELLICVKFGRGEFPTPFPAHVIIFWTIVSFLLIAYPVYRFGLRPMFIVKKRRRGSSLSGSNSNLGFEAQSAGGINGVNGSGSSGDRRLKHASALAGIVNGKSKAH